MWFYVVAVLACLFTWAYLHMTRHFGCFRAKGVKELPAYFPFGSPHNIKMFLGKKMFSLLLEDIYWENK